MAARALIIAVEKYASAAGLAKELPGTLQAGLNFQQWLIAKLQAENRAAGSQILFCSEPRLPTGDGAARADVLEAMLKLKEDGRGTTEELFFFFSGHGFSFVEKPDSRADVIITSDFRNNIISGDCCLNLDQIVNWLRDHLGPGKHYYFIDACRNNLNGSQVTVGSLLPTDLNAMPDASTFVLQSTVPGAVAMAGSLFPKTLMQGLQGQGSAKVWDPNVTDAMVVRYDSLRSFVKKSLEQKQPITSKVSGELGESDAVFTIIKPVPKVRCTIQIDGYGPGVQGVVKFKRGRVEEPPIAITEAFPPREMEPDTYSITVAIEGASVVPPSQLVDLYNDSIISFQMRPGFTGGGGLESLGGGDTKEIFLPQARQSVPRLSIARRLDGSYDAPEFSESLRGLVPDPDLNLWLALLGGGRILGPQGYYSKMSEFPLHDFAAEQPGASPIYIIAGFEIPDSKLSVSVSDTTTPRWETAKEPSSMTGIREAYAATRPGPKLVSFRLADHSAYTVASISSPNRGTLITLTLDEEGEFCVSQYLLPLGHLIGELDEEVRLRLKNRNHLQDVRFLAQACRAFRKRRNVFKDALSRKELNDLLYAKWLDPIGASLASYELLRRGQKEDMAEVVHNMQRYFADFPDTAALANFSGTPSEHPAGPPLFLDGLRAFPDYPRWLPLPASHLDYSSPWTAWRSAVK